MADVAPVRLGILGAAKIARPFCTAVAGSALVSIEAVASRDPERAQAFASEFGIPRSHGSYRSLLDDQSIEAVYIPLPNHLHAEWALRAIESGKHVLCEKPLAIGGIEVRAMFETARHHDLLLVEAYPFMSQPQTLRLRDLLKDGTLGRPVTVSASFGFPLCDADGRPLRDPGNIRLDKESGGGALLDAGTYPMSLIRIVAGERPRRVRALGRNAVSGVDLTVAATLDFPSGLVAQLGCSMATAGHRLALICGENGAVETSFSNHQAEAPLQLLVKRGSDMGTPFVPEPTPGGNGFRLEAEAFARAIRHGAASWNGATLAESLDIALALEAIATSLEKDDWVEVPSD